MKVRRKGGGRGQCEGTNKEERGDGHRKGRLKGEASLREREVRRTRE